MAPERGGQVPGQLADRGLSPYPQPRQALGELRISNALQIQCQGAAEKTAQDPGAGHPVGIEAHGTRQVREDQARPLQRKMGRRWFIPGIPGIPGVGLGRPGQGAVQTQAILGIVLAIEGEVHIQIDPGQPLGGEDPRQRPKDNLQRRGP